MSNVEGEPQVEPEPTRHVKLTFVAIVLVAFAVTTLLAYDMNQNRKAISQLKTLAAAQREFRIQRAVLTSQTDVLICRQIEKIKQAERQRDTRDFRNLDRNLRLLHIQKTTSLVKAAERDYRDNLRRLRPTDCSKLPTARGGAFPEQPKGKVR